ncbi:MAG TPA: YhbY family RNA-binding protein [Chthoniobacteraceae bacterium]|nr:YhbY family RNA-binding protein [Chthoniobacteraceae bacterium]
MDLTPSFKRELRARAQLIEPILKVGHAGVTDAFVASLREALDHHGLVKIRFTDFKDEKKTLAVEIASRSGAQLIARVGNVAVYYRTPAPQARPGSSKAE